MSERDIVKYCDVMEEIKLRMNVVDFYLSGKGSLYEPPMIETVGLQFRKILELVAFASLVANQAEYSTAYTDFAKHWNAGDLIKNLERINSNFYPRPIVEVLPKAPSEIRRTEARPMDYLDKKKFVEIYGRCGVLMHAANPYGSSIDYGFFKQEIPKWRDQLINLLNCHEIRLVGELGYYIIHMHELGDDKVHFYRFQPGGAIDSIGV